MKMVFNTKKEKVAGTIVALILSIIIINYFSFGPKPARIQTTTDKLIYAEGEVIRVTIKNNGNETIAIQPEGGSGCGEVTDWLIVEAYVNGSWIRISPRSLCLMVLWPIELKPGEERTWNVSEDDVFKFVIDVRHRIKILYEIDGSLMIGYSNEFKIKK